MGTPAHTNRLIHEKSPYLLQHAHNPVDWYPWGQEAFDVAKQQDKPVFLSIGYATCHWCHVMERESFENAEIAQLMNEAFVNIKVDREELPEIDSLYMEFAQALMSSAGGWPLNIILTSEMKPVFAMTYLPPVNKRGLIGMTHFIQHIRQIWTSNDRQQLLDQADKIVEIFQKMPNASGQELPSVQTVRIGSELMYEFSDPVHGGVKGEPKFPMSYQTVFLLEYARLVGDSRALFCAELTLDKMQRGGIYDHLGGGFSRYAVDERWMVPHFEKMLYDNALMAEAYLEAWKFTKKESYKETCHAILDYILREMTHTEGGFFSAQDADSDGHEGLFYTWIPSEIREVLGTKNAELFCAFYGVTEEGNFEGRSVLHMPLSVEEFAEEHRLQPADLKLQLAQWRAELLKKRAFRSAPFKDDKIITSWNAMTIGVMAKAGAYLDQNKYTQAAIHAVTFIQKHLWKDGYLLRRWRDQEARFKAGLDDYAFLIKALLTLFDQGLGTSWLEWAIQLTTLLEKEFKADKGAFYYKPEEPCLLLRKCEFYDGAEPSGNAVHAENLIRLFQITNQENYLKQAEDILKAAKLYMETYPPGACYHLIALSRYFDLKAPTLVIALDEEKSLEKEIKAVLASHACLHLQPVWKAMDDKVLPTLIISLVDKKPVDGQTAVYVCRQDRCEAPLLSKDEIVKMLQHL